MLHTGKYKEKSRLFFRVPMLMSAKDFPYITHLFN
jgi:hypothetical protein